MWEHACVAIEFGDPPARETHEVMRKEDERSCAESTVVARWVW
jgi:hypothetical protein